MPIIAVNTYAFAIIVTIIPAIRRIIYIPINTYKTCFAHLDNKNTNKIAKKNANTPIPTIIPIILLNSCG